MGIGTNAHNAGQGAAFDVGATGSGRFVETGTQLTVTCCHHAGIMFRAPGAGYS